jgi:NADH-quinone oxidoreductase subunit J
MLMLTAITFFLLAGIMLVSAVLVITRRNTVHSAIWLIVSLFAVGGIYLIQQAQFLFAVQIIVYVGGIMVLFLFVIMLVNLDLAAKQIQFNLQWRVGLVTVLVLAAQLAWGFDHEMRTGFRLPQVSPVARPAGNTQAVGLALYGNYMLPVEIASILLLVAMVGAVVMAKKKLD